MLSSADTGANPFREVLLPSFVICFLRCRASMALSHIPRSQARAGRNMVEDSHVEQLVGD